jgi:hypothetical protein
MNSQDLTWVRKKTTVSTALKVDSQAQWLTLVIPTSWKVEMGVEKRLQFEPNPVKKLARSISTKKSCWHVPNIPATWKA